MALRFNDQQVDIPLLRPPGARLLFCLLAILPAPALVGDIKAQTRPDPDLLLFEAYPMSDEVLVHSSPPATYQEEEISASSRAQLLAAVAIHEAELERVAVENGEFSDDLIPTLQQLSENLKNQGRHTEALEHLSRATYINRINHGLDYPGNIPLLESMLDSHLALGDLGEARNIESNILSLMRNTNGLDTGDRIDLNTRLADQNMDLFFNILHADQQPEFSISFNSSRRPVSPRQRAFSYLYQAQTRYLQIIMQILNTSGYSNPQLMELEYKHIEALFLTTYRQSLTADPDFYMGERIRQFGSSLRLPETRLRPDNYYYGRTAWQRMLHYQSNRPDVSASSLVNVLLEQADWEILFNRNQRGVRGYENAWQSLASAGMSGEYLEAVFNPPLPVLLPAFTTLPHSREFLGIAPDEPVTYEGHVDVEYTVSRYGTVRGIHILNKSDDIPWVVKSRLRSLLTSFPSRPRLSNGETIRNDQVQARFYYAFIDPAGPGPAQ